MSLETPTPPTPEAQILNQLKGLQDNQTKLESRLNELLTQSNQNRQNLPFIRSGESINSSRGFSFLRALGAMAGHYSKDDAKQELELCQRLRKANDAAGFYVDTPNAQVLPFSSTYLANTHRDETLAKEVQEMMRAGIAGYDRDQVLSLRQKYWGVQKALNWLDESQGGALVAPPMMGELIELLRNNEIFMRAGARTLAMPPMGRMVWPRQTGAGSAYWVGTSGQDRTITGSNPTTGDVTLTAKKLGCLVTIPNELFRFASVSIEMFVREDMAKVMALKMDKTFLDSVGSDKEPKGLINYANITSHSATTSGTNGDTFEPEDVAQMIGKVEEQNAIFKAFIMRPLMYTALSTRRADAVAAGDRKGQWLFNMWRELQGQYVDPARMDVGQLNGYPVFKSTQVDNTRSKGSASNLTYIMGGDFADFLIALSGTMEFAVATQGSPIFEQDQTQYRGILFCDGAPRHEASFVACDKLVIG